MELFRNGKRPTIGFLINQLEDGYCNLIWQGAADMAEEKDVNLIIFPGKGKDALYGYEYQHNAIYDMVNKHNLDAVVMASGALSHEISPEAFKEFYQSFGPLPLVSLSWKLDGITSVLVDNKSGMKEAITHLIRDHSCRRIAFILGTENNQEALERYQAYTETLEAHQIKMDPEIIAQGNFTRSSGFEAMKIILERRKVKCDAVVAANDEMALGAIEFLYSRDLHVPKDMLVIGFDDIEDAQFHIPPLSTIRQPLYEQAKKSVELAIDLAKGKEPPVSVVLPTRLIRRLSCGCLSQTVNLISGPSFQGKISLSQRFHLKKSIKKIMSQVLETHESSHYKEEEILSWVSNLAGVLSEEKANETVSNQFLQNLIDIIITEMNGEFDPVLWQNIITFIYHETLIFIKEKISVKNFEVLFQKSRVLVAEMTQLKNGIYKVETERHILLLSDVIQRLISILHLEELIRSVCNEMPRLGIKSSYISMYNDVVQHEKGKKWKMPEWSKLIMAYNENGRISLNEDKTNFLSRNMVPSGLFPKNRRFTFVMKPLFLLEDQFGFIIFELGSRDGSIYETLRLQISSSIKSSLLVRARNYAERKLIEALDELKESNQKLNNLSQTDELTGLYNRRGFIYLARQNLDLVMRMKRHGMLFFIDLDGLKKINDNYGHDEGDEAIKKTAEILEKTFRGTDIIARLGGDEFTIFSIDVTQRISEEIQARLKKHTDAYNKSSQKPYQLSMSFGAIPFNHNTENSLEELMAQADHLLYEQKKKKKSFA
jgi:diguanylate cyclase (GGDEF)-like protein